MYLDDSCQIQPLHVHFGMVKVVEENKVGVELVVEVVDQELEEDQEDQELEEVVQIVSIILFIGQN